MRRIDCDVHVAAPSIADLRPYLSDYWRDMLAQGRFGVPGGTPYTYPPWLEPLATKAADTTLEGIREHVLVPGVERAVLHCYFAVESVTHPYLVGELTQAVNRWLAAEYLDHDERLLASAVVPHQYPAAAVAEIERIADDRRFVQLLLPARSLMPYGNTNFWPIWEAAARHGLQLCVSYGGGTATPPTPVNWLGSYFEEYASSALAFEAQVTSLVFSGIFDAHPELRVVLAESGWTWLPALMWRMDKEWKSAQREVPWLTEPPSGYVRRFFRATTQPIDAPPTPGRLREVLDQIGDGGMLMFGSDFPHRYPEGVEELLAVLTPEEAERVLYGNALDCYGARLAAVPG